MGEPHDQGLVFKWGSLVGISIPSEGANNTSPFVAGDVEFTPDGFTGTITDDWASVPYCENDFAPYDNPATDHLSRINDPTAGLGDICRHMGVIDSANWRMPTAKDWEDLYGSNQPNGGRDTILGNGWVVGHYYPLSGRAMGAGRNYVFINYETLDTDVRVENVDPWINGAVFLPAGGHRNFTDGVLTNIGSGSWLWSTTACTENNGYDMGFYSTTITPYWVSERTHALPIRCIRE